MKYVIDTEKGTVEPMGTTPVEKDEPDFTYVPVSEVNKLARTFVNALGTGNRERLRRSLVHARKDADAVLGLLYALEEVA